MLSQESSSNPISAGGFKYQPSDQQDVLDFAGASLEELASYEAGPEPLDMSLHPAYVSPTED
jgi:hypothetical protein